MAVRAWFHPKRDVGSKYNRSSSFIRGELDVITALDSALDVHLTKAMWNVRGGLFAYTLFTYS